MSKEESERDVLDEHTRQIIFKKADNSLKEWIAFGSLEELVEQPLRDIDEIKRRQDTIEELVYSENLRERVSTICSAFNRDYPDFLSKLVKFIREKPFSIFEDYETSQIKNDISSLAHTAKNVPPSFRKKRFRTETVAALSKEYDKLLAGQPLIMEFFRYLVNVGGKIRKIDELGKGEKTAERKQISYEQLRGLLDAKKLKRYSDSIDFEKMKKFYNALYPYVGLAEKAVENKYTKPIVVPKEENCIIIHGGKYNLLRTDEVVSNDTDLEFNIELDKGCRVEVIEGPNDSGKTVDIKKAAYITAVALSGSWVPAKYVKVSIRDRIILREKGTGDAISALQQDCINIKETTPPSGEYWAVFLDETFTSTERKGGAALFYGTLKNILDQKNSVAVTSSHYLGLSKVFKDEESIIFNHFTSRKRRDKHRPETIEMLFSHKKYDGPLTKWTYAIDYAHSKGFDEKTLQYAEQRLKQRKEKLK